jgi:hypothetical protein
MIIAAVRILILSDSSARKYPSRIAIRGLI